MIDYSPIVIEGLFKSNLQMRLPSLLNPQRQFWIQMVFNTEEVLCASQSLIIAVCGG